MPLTRPALLLFATACTADPGAFRQAPADATDSGAAASADGTDGTDGTSGTDGTDGTDTGGGDPGLDWDGPLAAYDGCEASDPPAKLLSQTVPEGPVDAGGVVLGDAIFANCSGDTWLAAASDDASSGVKLGAATDTVMESWGRPRVALPADVPPDHAVRIQVTGTAPWTNGEHGWRWQLVDEWVEWIEAPTPPATVAVAGGYGPFDVHSREAWQTSSEPVTGPDSDLLDLRNIVLHYNGGSADLDGADDVYGDDDIIGYLRNTQSSYLSSRGYSLGYNSVIAPDGDEWEVRAHDVRSAANGCTDTNRAGYAIQLPTTSIDAPPTAAQVEGARAAILRIRRAAAAAGNPHTLVLVGHGDVRPLCSDGAGTSCPGTPIRDHMDAGDFEP